jgi:hypothetical protein
MPVPAPGHLSTAEQIAVPKEIARAAPRSDSGEAQISVDSRSLTSVDSASAAKR